MAYREVEWTYRKSSGVGLCLCLPQLRRSCMPTSTFPMWWNKDTIVALLNAARGGASYQELDEIIRKSFGGNWGGKFRAWVMAWKDRPSDRPQARLAAAIAAYDPPASRESAAMDEGCGERPDHPPVAVRVRQHQGLPGRPCLPCVRGAGVTGATAGAR